MHSNSAACSEIQLIRHSEEFQMHLWGLLIAQVLQVGLLYFFIKLIVLAYETFEKITLCMAGYQLLFL